jgi:hypothetical protein
MLTRCKQLAMFYGFGGDCAGVKLILLFLGRSFVIFLVSLLFFGKKYLLFFGVFAICEEKIFIVLVFCHFCFLLLLNRFPIIEVLCLKYSKYELHGFSHLSFDVKDVP